MVSLPQPEQLVRVSTLGRDPEALGPNEEVRLALQALQRLGSFLNCLSWKNSCSPAVKTKSVPQSIHFKTLSWNSMESCSLQPAIPSRGLGSTRNCQQDRTEHPNRQPQIPVLRYIPLGSAHHAQAAWLTAIKLQRLRATSNQDKEKQGPPLERRPTVLLVLLFTSLFATALARQRFFHTLLFARLEVEGMSLDLLDDVLLLDLTLEASQGVF